MEQLTNLWLCMENGPIYSCKTFPPCNNGPQLIMTCLMDWFLSSWSNVKDGLEIEPFSLLEISKMNHLFKATDESHLGGGCLLNSIMHGWWKINNWPCWISINENIVKWVSCLVPEIDAPSRIGSTCLVDLWTINKLEKWSRFLCAC